MNVGIYKTKMKEMKLAKEGADKRGRQLLPLDLTELFASLEELPFFSLSSVISLPLSLSSVIGRIRPGSVKLGGCSRTPSWEQGGGHWTKYIDDICVVGAAR